MPETVSWHGADGGYEYHAEIMRILDAERKRQHDNGATCGAS
jgi:hypothetical protein